MNNKPYLSKQINDLTDDWLTPCNYLPYINALLGDIDLDPCSTHSANVEFVRAKKIYTLEEDGLNIEEPWTGKTYLFPPTFGRCSFSKERGTWRWSVKAGAAAKAPSVIWFRRLVREWKLRNVPEALFYTLYPEMMRTCPEMWDFPVVAFILFVCVDMIFNWFQTLFRVFCIVSVQDLCIREISVNSSTVTTQRDLS